MDSSQPIGTVQSTFPITQSASASNRPQRLTAAQALAKLQNLLETESGDEDNESDVEDEVDTRNTASSDEDSNKILNDESDENETDDDDDDGTVFNDDVESGTSDNHEFVLSRDDTKWEVVSRSETVGRFQRQNVLKAKSGVTAYTRLVTSPIEAFRCLIDEGLLRHIKNCTVEFARLSDETWEMSDSELDAFIGLLYLRGVMNAKSFPLNLLWSKKYGCESFRKAMSRNRFREVKKNIRFDLRSTRQERLTDDKFGLMSWVLTRFVENSQKSYIPEESLTIDEQLFPTKARCRFTQYMPNKPDKFGIKFWILADLNTKYCLNMKPYLGKDEQRTENLATHVVMTLMEPYFGKGYNITTDNFFTNRYLARKLLDKRTSIVGTVRLNRKEIPAVVQPLALHDSKFYSSDSVSLVRYQAKSKKVVVVLSTMHAGAVSQPDGKRKPESVLYYNQNKCGVDMLDSMCRQMSTKAGCRRWPLAVFYNILDMAGVNAWIIFKKATGSRISRRKFLHKLSEELIDAAISENAPQPYLFSEEGKLLKRVQCQVKLKCKRNSTSTVCMDCKRPVCGMCLANVCMRCNTSDNI